MNFELIRDDRSNTVQFRGRIEMREIEALKLNLLDAAVLASLSDGSPPHDILLALEIVYRRAAESSVGQGMGRPDPETKSP